jgi:YaiO family outer membrane protein
MFFKKKLFLISICFLGLISSENSIAQSFSSDELFQQARSAAFDKKDYPKAIELSKEALAISPDYSDIRIFAGRVYTWWDKVDSAESCFLKVLKDHPDYEDASSAYFDLQYWNDHPEKALLVSEKGLEFHPESKTLLFKKAKALIALKRFKEGNNILNELLKTDPKNAAARSLLENVREENAKNKIGISYDFVNFDKQFSDPWHIVSLDYTRATKMGSITGRLNYANRFKTDGVQFEMDAYPRISKTFYSYVNAGISNESGVFPKYRSGFSLYANLPKSFEGEVGFRYLYFNDATWIYTGSVGKYFKNYWFNLRTYITPSNQSVSNSYSFSTRYYFKGTDYFGVGLGTGISPDERGNNVQLANLYQLKSYRLSADYRNTFKRYNILLASFSWLQQEYLPKVKGNQYLFSIGYQRKF